MIHPASEDSPVPSISPQGSSWIDRLYGGTGEEATSNPTNPGNLETSSPAVSQQGDFRGENEPQPPTRSGSRNARLLKLKPLSQNSHPGNSGTKPFARTWGSGSFGGKKITILQVMSDIKKDPRTVTAGSGIVKSAQDAKAELIERIERWER